MRSDEAPSAARRLHALGVAATASGRPAVGARTLREALQLLASADGEPGVRSLRGRILLSLALAEAEQGRVTMGLNLLDEAATHLDDDAMLHGQRGVLLARTGRLAEAIQHLDRAIDVLATAREPVELSRALLNRAYTRMNAGQLRQARADLLRCLRLARHHRVTSVVIKAVENLGYLDFFAGNAPRALRQFDQAAQDCAQHLPSYLPLIVAGKARVLLSVGLVEDASRELDTAIESFRRQRLSQDHAEAELARAAAELLAGRPAAAYRLASIARRRFLRRANHTWVELASLVQLRAAFAAGSPPLPLGRRGERVGQRLARLGLVDDARTAALLAVRAYLRAGRPARAAEVAGRIRPPRTGDPLELRLSWHLTGAELAAERGEERQELRHLRAGLTRLHQHRSLLGSMDLQTGIAAHGRDLTTTGLATALATGRPDLVFEWAELARAQAFRVTTNHHLNPKTDPETAFALEELRHVRFALREAELRREPVGKLRARRSELERTVRERAWFKRGPGTSSPVVPLRRVWDELSGQAMVLYLRTDELLGALVLAAGSATVISLTAYRSVDEQLRRLHADLNALAGRAVPAHMADALRKSRQRDAQRLADMLLGPLIQHISDRQLIIIPTGVLFGVPWQQMPPLSDRPVVVAPSATAWITSQHREPTPSQRPALLVAGPGLSNSEREVRSIATTVPEPVCLTGQAATPAAVIDHFDGAPLAHFAAHGHHEPGNPLFSCLDLVGGPLMGYDLQQLRLPPRMVVLSSCELGLSSVRAGDEILGMVAALLAAGSTTVIASVSRPIDQAVPEIMSPFHRLLANGTAPAQALATAVTDPAQASFVCFGSG